MLALDASRRFFDKTGDREIFLNVWEAYLLRPRFPKEPLMLPDALAVTNYLRDETLRRVTEWAANRKDFVTAAAVAPHIRGRFPPPERLSDPCQRKQNGVAVGPSTGPRRRPFPARTRTPFPRSALRRGCFRLSMMRGPPDDGFSTGHGRVPAPVGLLRPK